MKKLTIINKDFTKLLIASTITRFGDSVDTIAFSWLVYVLTGSRVLMGAVFAVSYIPNLIVLPFGGVIADILNKKIITVIGDFLRALSVLSLALVYSLGYLEVYMIFIFVIINSLFESFANPSRSSLLQSLLDKETYLRGSSLLSSAKNLGGLVGLAIAGGLIAIMGVSGALFIDAGTFIISGTCILFIEYVDHQNKDEVKQSLRQSLNMIQAGFNYLKSKPFMILLIIIASFINFAFVPMNVLRPVYVTNIMNMGVEGLSYLGFSILLGMSIGGLVMSIISKYIRPISTIGMGILLIGSTYAGLGFINFLPISGLIDIIVILLIAFMFGVAFTVVQAPITSLIMERTDSKMIGRLSSIMAVFSMASLPLGGALVSVIGDALSVDMFFMMMGALTLVTGGIFFILSKGYRSVEASV
jgi:DHA3 family macrolide efflux protein-like MFS transporter